MKVYKCDRCFEEFDSKDGMIDGQYVDVRKMQFYAPSPGWDIDRNKGEKWIIKKTIELYKIIAAPQLPSRDVLYKKDLCLECVKRLDKS
jgi:hypothetical protein